MSAIKLVNHVAIAVAEFRLYQGDHQVARVGVHYGGEASIPTSRDGEVGTVQSWSIYAIVEGITTPAVTLTDPNATVTAVRNVDDQGCSLVVR